MNVGWVKWAGKRAVKGVVKNALFRFAPAAGDALLRLRGESGRATPDATAAQTADYFVHVVDDYEAIAAESGLAETGRALWTGQRVLELGPGDTLSVAALALERGAAGYDCFDEFDILSRERAYSDSIYGALATRAGIEGGLDAVRRRAGQVRYFTSTHALRTGGGPYDLVVSRSVLEHASDVEALLRDALSVMTPEGAMLHKVDLQCHGIRFENELDFLTFPEPLYLAMSSHLGEPNRHRVDEYLRVAGRLGLTVAYLTRTHTAPLDVIARMRPRLAQRFRGLSDGVLACLGFWVVLLRPGHPLAAKLKAAGHTPPRPEDLTAPRHESKY